jgi:hypothetical protein
VKVPRVAPVPAGLAALRDHNLGLRLHGLLQMLQVLALANQDRTRCVDLCGRLAWVAKRQHHCGWPAHQRICQEIRISCHRPRDEPNTHPLALGCCELLIYPFRVAVPTADEPETA